MPKPANKFKTLNIILQNARGLKTNHRINEISSQIKKQGLFAVCLQETWKHELLERLEIKPIDHYVSHRQLSWLGHTVRMPFKRLPRKLLSFWVRNRRPRGCPEFTYGRGIYKALRTINVGKNSWYDLALDRVAWKNVLNGL